VPNGTHFRKFAALLWLQYGPAKAGFRLKAVLPAQRPFVSGLTNNFTFASTLQDKVIAIRLGAIRGQSYVEIGSKE